MPDREPANPISIRLNPDPWFDEGRHSALVQGEFRVHDVSIPISSRLGDISRQRETGKGGETEIVRSPDTRLQHPPAPCWNPSLIAKIVNRPGASQSPDRAGFDTDHLTGPQLQRQSCVSLRPYGLVEADRSIQEFVQPRVIRKVLVSQGLLHH